MLALGAALQILAPGVPDTNAAKTLRRSATQESPASRLNTICRAAPASERIPAGKRFRRRNAPGPYENGSGTRGKVRAEENPVTRL